MRTLFTVPGKQVVRSRCAWRSISTCQSRSSSSWNQRPLELSRRQKWGCQPSSSPLCCSERSRAEWARCNRDRKSTRLNSSHDQISYAVFCLKKKKTRLEIRSHRESTPSKYSINPLNYTVSSSRPLTYSRHSNPPPNTMGQRQRTTLGCNVYF